MLVTWVTYRWRVWWGNCRTSTASPESLASLFRQCRFAFYCWQCVPIMLSSHIHTAHGSIYCRVVAQPKRYSNYTLRQAQKRVYLLYAQQHGGQKQIANADDNTQRRTRPHKRNCVSMCQIINSSDLCVTRRTESVSACICASVCGFVRVFCSDSSSNSAYVATTHTRVCAFTFQYFTKFWEQPFFSRNALHIRHEKPLKCACCIAVYLHRRAQRTSRHA